MKNKITKLRKLINNKEYNSNRVIELRIKIHDIENDINLEKDIIKKLEKKILYYKKIIDDDTI